MTSQEGITTALKILRQKRASVSLVLTVSIVTAILSGAGQPLVQKVLFDSLIARDMRLFAIAAALMIVVGTAMRALGYVATLTRQRVKNELAIEATERAVETFYSLRHGEILKRDRTYFVARVFDEPQRMTEQLVDTANRVVSALITVVGAVTVAIWLTWQVTLIVAVVLPPVIWLARRSHRRIVGESTRATELEATVKDDIGRAIEAYSTVKIFDLLATVTARLRDGLGRHRTALYDRTRSTARYQNANAALLMYAEAAVLLGAGLAVLTRVLTIGGLLAFLSAYWRVVDAVTGLAREIPNIGQLESLMERAKDLEKMRGDDIARAVGGHVELHGVCVGYGGIPVLDRFSLGIHDGQRILVTGSNGSGKSTLVRTLLGLLPVTSGQAIVPSIHEMSAVLHPAAFIPGTLKDNVQLTTMSPDRRHQFTLLTEQFGLSHLTDRDPRSLSQGEQRKAQVLMALMKDARYYILDEPLANVDIGSRDAVLEAIFRVTEGRTLIVIMHEERDWSDHFDYELRLGTPSCPFGDTKDVSAIAGTGWTRSASIGV